MLTTQEVEKEIVLRFNHEYELFEYLESVYQICKTYILFHPTLAKDSLTPLQTLLQQFLDYFDIDSLKRTNNKLLIKILPIEFVCAQFRLIKSDLFSGDLYSYEIPLENYLVLKVVELTHFYPNLQLPPDFFNLRKNNDYIHCLDLLFAKSKLGLVTCFELKEQAEKVLEETDSNILNEDSYIMLATAVPRLKNILPKSIDTSLLKNISIDKLFLLDSEIS